MTVTADAIFAAMGDAMPTIKGKFPAKTIVMTIDGKTYTIDGKNASVKEGESSEKPDLSVTTSVKTLSSLVEKKLSPQQAFMKGALKIKGNMALAMKLTILMNATRRHLLTTSRL